MRQFFGYVRVSTMKQGEHGVSLQEQRDAIERYALRHEVEITRWFEERETAAKRGRPVFAEMLTLLRRRRADGVIIHKIDRSARNLRDWSDLLDLSEQCGFELHFANESVDLSSRGGRLAADIQAVVAADYVRNLREEIRKGFYGRLKQGLYPMKAPLGYLDQGPGKPKIPDPSTAPLIRKLFELYASGSYTLETLAQEARFLGLCNHKGNPVSLSGISTMLNNAFYIGLIRIQRSGETFVGIHEPLISKSVFDRAQRILKGRTPVRGLRHDFLFRQFMRCGTCGYFLRGELQKGRIYYRCHTRECMGNCVREDDVESGLGRILSRLTLGQQEWGYLEQKLPDVKDEAAREQQKSVAMLALRRAEVDARLNRLTDALIDRLIDKQVYESRKATLLGEQKDIEEKQHCLDVELAPAEKLTKLVELAGNADFLYEMASAAEKRELLKVLGSNCLVTRKNIDFTLFPAFQLIANRQNLSKGGPSRGTGRTWDGIVTALLTLIHDTPSALFDQVARSISEKNDDSAHSSNLTHQTSHFSGNNPAGISEETIGPN